MKFKKAKCRVSHINRNNPRHQNTLGSNRLGISFDKENLCVLGDNKLKHAPLSRAWERMREEGHTLKTMKFHLKTVKHLFL